jgi:cellulose synthase/poly-beta-1,6-N-acetylglucosamine synthase-like glycosyltransferase
MPEWLATVLLYLAWVNLAVVVICFGLLAAGYFSIRRLKDVQPLELSQWPSVSLIVPGRNEELHVEEAVRSLAKIDYPNLEFTIINDRSTDRTGEILDALAAEFPQLNVVHLKELPAGWLGKNHALQLGADRSRGEWLLFADADIVFDPSVLKRAILYAQKNQLDHLTAWPDIFARSWLMQSFLSTFAIVLFMFVRVWALKNPKSKAHIGVGAFNLVRTKAYRAVGGHGSIRMRPDDDLKLGKILKVAGFRPDFVDARGLLSLEMYPTVGVLVRAMEKNAFAGVDYRPTRMIAGSAFVLLGGVWPFLAAFAVPGPARWVYASACLGLLLICACGTRVVRAPLSCALGFPLAALLLVYIQWRTMLLTYYKGGMQWRDTYYPLAELRANRV